MEKALRDAIEKLWLSDNADGIVAHARPAIRLVTHKDAPHSIGSSQLGGVPDVPADFSWPARKDGAPLGHVLQINFAEVAAADVNHVFPASGMLYVFSGIMEFSRGKDPDQSDRFRVIYMPEPGALAPAVPPENLDPEDSVSALQVTFESYLAVPNYEEIVKEVPGLVDWEDEYPDLFYEILGKQGNEFGKHHLLGWPILVQDAMEMTCEFASHGIPANEGNFDDPRYAELKARAGEWRLLAQIDTDLGAKLVWSDGGMLYLWIREEDLKARRFEKAWACVQFY